jgi:hypothetical protein
MFCVPCYPSIGCFGTPGFDMRFCWSLSHSVLMEEAA